MPTVYGIEHLLYLTAVALIGGAVLFFVKKHVTTERGVDSAVRILGAVLLAAIVWNRLSIAITRGDFSGLLPGSFCGASSLALAVAAITLKRNHVVFHCIAYVGWVGALITQLYPDFIGQGPTIWYPMTISGLTHHSVMFLLVTMMVMTGFLKPDPKKWIALPLGLSVYMVYGLFLITVLGYGDAMYIYHPILSGTPLNWIVLGPIFFALQGLFLLAWVKTHPNRAVA